MPASDRWNTKLPVESMGRENTYSGFTNWSECFQSFVPATASASWTTNCGASTLGVHASSYLIQVASILYDYVVSSSKIKSNRQLVDATDHDALCRASEVALAEEVLVLLSSTFLSGSVSLMSTKTAKTLLRIISIPIAPWAIAGSISSTESIAVTVSVMFSRFSPAKANKVAWTSPSLSFFNRVWTFPLKLTTCN
ncbi:hypothetical protein B296_00015251 [Ensete ventricosum]|uniref:Uncharacterized protein n=1 Tax=Ensete ventricosum TaxID=4639 RepID=A0A427B6K3_ENSVE|nr:hypothetical protein B296_00015251 [Ensete ventricosum]